VIDVEVGVLGATTEELEDAERFPGFAREAVLPGFFSLPPIMREL